MFFSIILTMIAAGAGGRSLDHPSPLPELRVDLATLDLSNRDDARIATERLLSESARYCQVYGALVTPDALSNHRYCQRVVIDQAISAMRPDARQAFLGSGGLHSVRTGLRQLRIP